MATTPTVCQYYLRNNCAYGDQCIHYHPKETSPNTAPGQATCLFFLAGNCRFGSFCKNAHPPIASSVAQVVVQPTSRSNGISSSSNGESSSANSSRMALCPHFKRGSCRYGAVCRMVHILPTAATTARTPKPSLAVFGPCRFFVAGTCTKGSTCPFPHPVMEGTSSLETETSANAARPVAVHVENLRDMKTRAKRGAKESSSALSTRDFYRCNVMFSSGSTVEDVQTAFETRRIILRNLPQDASQEEVVALASTYGTLEHASIHIGPSVSTAHVDFEEWRNAEKASSELRELEIRGRKVSVQLDLASHHRDQASLRSTKVRVSWFAPSSMAWAHYGSISTAQQHAERLNGAVFDRRKLQATFQKPSFRQTRSFSVAIRGLPSEFSEAGLKNFCRAQSLDVRRPEHQARNAQDHVVSNLLSEHGHLEQFETISPVTAAGKVVAFAHFDDPKSADSAARALHNVPQHLLGKSPLWVEVIHSIKYTVPRAQFFAMLPDIERISATHAPCKIKWYTEDAHGHLVDPVVVRAYSSGAKELGRLKHEMDGLVSGIVLCYDGKVLWSQFFEDDEGRACLLSLGKTLGADVRADIRTRTVRLFGNAAVQSEAESRLQEELVRLVQQWKSIPLESRALRAIMTNLGTFGSSIPKEDLSLDILKRQVRIRGSGDDVHKLKRELDVLLSQGKDRLNGNNNDDCPVCFCPVDDKVDLPCGHSYCRGCMQELLTSAASQEFATLRCVEQVGDKGCASSVPLTLIRDLLSPEMEAKLLMRLFLSFVNSRPEEYHYCPSPDCEVVYRRGLPGTVLTCPACLERICPSCCVGFHEGLTCAEHRDNISGGYRALQKWREEHGVKPCPKCGVDIEKSAGCNHMTCARCGTHMCWVCLQTFPNGGGGSVYDHMNRAHGGIGIGLDGL